MKQTKDHYFCDTCGKELTTVKHLSMEGVGNIGWVKPPKWIYPVKGYAKFYTFCDLVCFDKFITPKGKEDGKSSTKPKKSAK